MEESANENSLENAGVAVEALHGISIHVVESGLSIPRQKELTAFWLANKAIGDAREAERRVKEVICLALDSAGRIVGVSTVYRGKFGQEHEPYWFYRTFIQPNARFPGVAVRLLRWTLRALKSRALDARCRGVMVVTENRRLAHPGWRKKLQAEGLTRLGTTKDGKDVWKLEF